MLNNLFIGYIFQYENISKKILTNIKYLYVKF